MSDDKESKRIYRQPINYENGIILPAIRDCFVARAINPKAYQINVHSLSFVLPSLLRDKAFEFWNKDQQQDLTMNGKKDIDDYFVYILKLLEEHNICLPKISYDQGKL